MNEQAFSYRVACYTLGCKVNSYESQAMLEQFGRLGCRIVEPNAEADVYLVNTCTVTQIAARKSRQMLSRMRKQNPLALVVACGCYVDQNQSRENFLSDLADLIIPNSEKANAASKVLAELAKRGDEGKKNEEASCCEEPSVFSISSAGSHTRAFLKVQDGCRQFCSYCIIPYVRGPLRSKPIEEAVQEAAVLAENGCKEIVLTGIHLSSYGRDLTEDVDLGDLILALQEVPDISRIRLGSLEVGLITDDFLEKIKQADRLCPHFHLSLQSGSKVTLHSMNRKYTPEQFQDAVHRIREVFPEAAITTDVIVGFPGETDGDFEASYRFVEQIAFSDIHVFPYSPREGTAAAARKDQVDDATKTERSKKMLALKASLAEQFAAGYVGQRVEVLLEQRHANGVFWEGYTRNYLRVHVPETEEAAGRLRKDESVWIDIESLQHTRNGVYLLGVYHGE